MKLSIVIMVFITGSILSGDKFDQLLKLNQNKDYFKLIENYDNSELNDGEKLYINALVLNLRNRNEESNELVSVLLDKYKGSFHDSLVMQLYETKMKNSVNMFNYKDAVICTETIINNYFGLLDSTEKDDMKNSLVIWQAAKELQEQSVEITGDSRIKVSRYMAGLINIPVKCGGVEEDFIFDTGANFSVVNDTYAEKMKLVKLPGKIQVGSVTGTMITSQLAYAPLFEIGSMKFKNVLFLVMPDESLSFAGGLYVIDGIIGLPVIKEMKEIHIKEKEIFVPKQKTTTGLGNLLVDGFIPVIEVVDGKDSLAFTFDTGAKRTLLYSSYYTRNKADIDKNYKMEEIEFGGAGGTVKVKGFKLDNKLFKVGSSKFKLEDISLLAENIKDHDKSFFGNLGQDYMGEFGEMILNFEDMYVDFRK
ncbi:MAG: retropepsin-like aspartic protease [Ignavibacteria bacterium]